MLSVLNTLTERLRVALEQAFPEAAAARASGASLDPQLAPASKPEFGDFRL